MNVAWHCADSYREVKKKVKIRLGRGPENSNNLACQTGLMVHSFRAGPKTTFKTHAGRYKSARSNTFFIIFFLQIRNPESEQHEQRKEFYFTVLDSLVGSILVPWAENSIAPRRWARDFVSPDLFCREHVWLLAVKLPAAAISYWCPFMWFGGRKITKKT